MSVWIGIKAKRDVNIYETDVTYNLSKMYYKAIDEELGLRKFNGMNCNDAIPILEKAISDMENNKKEYEKFNPENGWGSYEGLLRRFREILEICKNNPDGIIETD